MVLHPPECVYVIRMVEFKPEDPGVLARFDGKAAFAEMGTARYTVEGERHPFMPPRTHSLDFAAGFKAGYTCS